MKGGDKLGMSAGMLGKWDSLEGTGTRGLDGEAQGDKGIGGCTGGTVETGAMEMGAFPRGNVGPPGRQEVPPESS